MYYKSVNRGLVFTKPGIYGISFVFSVGFLAIVSGINGLYLFLSLGLAVLIISGLLSEKAMKHARFKQMSSARVDANKPFQMTLELENTSRNFPIFGLENYIYTEKPQLKWFSIPRSAPIEATSLKLLPGQNLKVMAKSSGLTRGDYRSFVLYQKTTYPFGLLEKFRILKVDSDVIVAPAIDQSFFRKISDDLRNKRQENDLNSEFYSHRPYRGRESLKRVDWKRSAGKNPKDWVIKLHKSDESDNHVIVKWNEEYINACQAEEQYERTLNRYRSCFEALKVNHFSFSLEVNGQYLDDLDVCLRFLATRPQFRHRHKTVNQAAFPFKSQVKPGMHLNFSQAGYYWDSKLDHKAARLR